MSEKEYPHPGEPKRYGKLPCETPDGLCELLELKQGIVVVDSLAGTSLSFTPPGEFAGATMERDHDTLGHVVVLHFRVGGETVVVKSVAGTLILPADLKFNLVDEFPPIPTPQAGVINIFVAANAFAQAKAFADANARVDIDSPCCLVVPPCQTGVATYVQRGLGFFDRPVVQVTGLVVIIRFSWGAEEVKSVYYYADQCGRRARREVEIGYFFDAPYAGQQVAEFIPQAAP